MISSLTSTLMMVTNLFSKLAQVVRAEGGTCRSCQSTLPYGQDVCSQCKDFAFCPVCKTLILPHRFDGSINCSEYIEKQMKPLRKSAFGGVIAEVPLSCSELDVNFTETLNTPAQTITDLIQRRLNQHT